MGRGLANGRAIVVYCAHGLEIGRDTAASLREIGLDARFLEGGITEWAELKLPLRRERDEPLCWVKRERPKIDRIACPWLIRRFIDPEALDMARATGAIAYDIPGAEPFSHDGEPCSFDAFLKVYGIADAALDTLAVIVRGAGTARLELAPQAAGLLALSRGHSADFGSDHEMLEHGSTM